MSDTPRTDAQTYVAEGWAYVDTEFAKELEMELKVSLENQVKAQAEIERLRKFLGAFAQFAELNGSVKLVGRNGAFLSKDDWENAKLK